MFNRYLVQPRSPDVHVHNTVQQKPHDPADAARLYGELKDRAELEVLNAVVERLGADNEVTVVKVDHQTNLATDTLSVRLLFKINGRLHEVISKPDRHELTRQCYRAVAETIMNDVWKNLSAMRVT